MRAHLQNDKKKKKNNKKQNKTNKTKHLDWD